MAINLWDLRSNLNWKGAATSTEGVTQSSVNYLHRQFLILLQLLFVFLCHCFSFMSACLSSKSFRNNQMHCEIIDRYFNVFLLKNKWKKKIWNDFFGHQSLGAQTGIPDFPKGLDTSLPKQLTSYLQLHYNLIYQTISTAINIVRQTASRTINLNNTIFPRCSQEWNNLKETQSISIYWFYLL